MIAHPLGHGDNARRNAHAAARVDEEDRKAGAARKAVDHRLEGRRDVRRLQRLEGHVEQRPELAVEAERRLARAARVRDQRRAQRVQPRPPILAPRLLPPPFLTTHRTATAQAEKDPEKKKAMLSARQAELKAVTPEAKAEQGKKAKAAYSSMYKSFCADATKSSSAVCSNAVLKNIYGK